MEGMRRIGILFLGGAKRVSMARLFIARGRELGLDVRIFSYEATLRVPIAEVGTVICGLRWRDPEIYDDLARVCRDNGISVVIPFVDGAVEVAARFAAMTPGVFAPSCAPESAEGMFDKCRANHIFESLGLPVPRSFASGAGCRWIAKPVHGSASQGIVFPSDDAEAQVLAESGEYLVQELIQDRREYTVDCYVNVADGAVVAVSPRLRIETVGGEVSRTVTVDRPDICALTHRLLDGAGLRGAVTVQFIEDNPTGRVMVMEVNPRLGGGAVCSVYADVDLPRMIMLDSLGTPSDTPVVPRPGVEMCRYMQEVIFYE